VAIAIVLAVTHWLVMSLVPPPGGVAGDLSPEGNLGAWIDRAVLGGHLWKPRWDPEGLLSTVPALSTTLLGIVAGRWLGSQETPERKATGLALAGVAGVAAGHLWSIVLPFNKNIWTSSYVLFTAGGAALLLAACYWIIDVRGSRGWTKPFVVLGSNAITLFVVSGLLARTLSVVKVPAADGGEVSLGRYIYVTCFAPFTAPKNASLLYAFANLVVLFGLLAWMYRHRLFLRV
jgi:predicted acyltransferase